MLPPETGLLARGVVSEVWEATDCHGGRLQAWVAGWLAAPAALPHDSPSLPWASSQLT